jgi:hypothetical protein
MKVNHSLKKIALNLIPIIIFIVICFAVISYLFHPFCRNKFGIAYNSKRRNLHIPVIPDTWKIKQRDLNMIWWMGKELVIGHESKRVTFSGCEIDEETDDYFFSLQQTQDRTLQIRYKYANSQRKKDSISFRYKIGYYAKFITAHQADSIFKINKMEKDY